MKTILYLILLVTSPNSVTDTQAVQVMSIARSKIAEAGVELRYTKFQKTRDLARGYQFKSASVGGQQMAIYYRYKGRIEAMRRAGQLKTNVHVILPPMIDEVGNKWLGGVASRGSACSKRAFSVSNATMYSATGVSRVLKSGLIAAHEILHALGAEHNDTQNNVMMTGYSGEVTAQSLPVLPQTVKQISRCRF